MVYLLLVCLSELWRPDFLFTTSPFLPWVSRSKRWPVRCPPDSSWPDEQTCTPGLSVSTCLSGTPYIPPVSATLCHGYVLCSSPWRHAGKEYSELRSVKAWIKSTSSVLIHNFWVLLCLFIDVVTVCDTCVWSWNETFKTSSYWLWGLLVQCEMLQDDVSLWILLSHFTDQLTTDEVIISRRRLGLTIKLPLLTWLFFSLLIARWSVSSTTFTSQGGKHLWLGAVKQATKVIVWV